MSWFDGQVDVRHYFHQDTQGPSLTSGPPLDGAVITFQYIVNRGFFTQQIVPGTNPPSFVSVPQVEIHYIWTMNPNAV